MSFLEDRIHGLEDHIALLTKVKETVVAAQTAVEDVKANLDDMVGELKERSRSFGPLTGAAGTARMLADSLARAYEAADRDQNRFMKELKVADAQRTRGTG